MLIQQLACALGALFLQNAFGFGSAKPGPVGFGLFRRLFSLSALFKSLQVDHLPHACLHHPANGGRAKFSRKRSRLADSVVIRKSPSLLSDSINKNVPLCENEISCALPRPCAMTIAHRSQSLGGM